MPNSDKTGPEGRGPATGRGMNGCLATGQGEQKQNLDGDQPLNQNSPSALNRRGQACRRGFGPGQGMGRGLAGGGRGMGGRRGGGRGNRGGNR